MLKMKGTKKCALSIILCIAMCLALFAGCSGQDADSSGSSSNEGTSNKTSDDSLNEDTTDLPKLSGKIVVGGWPAGDEAFKAVIPMFNEKYPDVEVELQFQQGSDYNQMLTTALAAGTGAPDVAMMEQAWVGRYRDSTEFENLLEPPYNAESMKNDFVEYKWNLALSVDGKRLVGLVWDIGPASMFYRRDVFEDAGLPSEPEEVEKLMSTWDGVLEAAEAIHIPNERWLFPSAASMFSWNYMNRDFYTDKLELKLDKPGALEALEAAIEMRKRGLDAQYIQSSEYEPALAEGKVAAHVSGCWFGGFLKSWIAPDTGGLWGITRLPGGIGDSNWGGSYVGIPSQSENKEAAWEFILFTMATKEGQNGMFKAVDYFPGYIPAWDDPMYEEEDPFFGGQKTRALWVDISKGLQPTFSTLMDSTTESIINNVVNTGLNEGKSADAIIEDVIKEVKEGTKQDYEANLDILRDAGLID
jgi:ABC-type glycerol-3-phosphate transport system substrate-binding protein